MNLETFKASLGDAGPPSGMSALLEALWWDAKGDWDKAHKIAQKETSAEAFWVHAYLHRVEGDFSNARYWYRRAERPESSLTTEAEWAEVASALLEGG